MGSAAFGIGWLLWRQNRTGLIGLAAYLIVMLIGLRLCSGHIGSTAEQVLAATFLGYSLLFLAGLGCLNLFSDEQSFKPYLFTLPVKTRSLVLWHMIYPIGAAIIVWLVGAWLLFVPAAGTQILWWPMALIAVMISVWQAALWYPAAWYLRPVFIVLGMAGPAVLLGQAWMRDMPVEAISVWLLPMVPIAAVIAVRGVSRARHGQTSKRMPKLDEMGLAGLAIERTLGGDIKRPVRTFRNSRMAQLWLEWRTNGIVLPVMALAMYLATIPIVTLVVGGMGGFSFTDLGIGHIQTYGSLRWGLFLIPTTAMLLVSVGAGLYQGAVRRDGTLEPFFATRPMTSWELVVAKIIAATNSALLTWAITCILTFLWLLLPARDGSRHGPLGAMLLLAAPPKTILYMFAGLIVLMLWSWRAGVCALCIGLSGRKWLGWIAVGLFALQIGVVFSLRAHPSLAADIARLLPDPAAALAGIKPILAGFVIFLLRRKNLAPVGALMKVAGGWIAATAVLSAFLIWLLPPALAPARNVVSGVVLLLPLVRPLLAPLALNWNRHR